MTQKVTFSFLSQSWAETAAWCWRTLLLDKMQWVQNHWQSHAAGLGDCSAILISFQPEIYICTPKHPLKFYCNDTCHNVLSKNLYRNFKSLLYFSLEMTETLHRMKQFLYVVCTAFGTPKRWKNLSRENFILLTIQKTNREIKIYNIFDNDRTFIHKTTDYSTSSQHNIYL